MFDAQIFRDELIRRIARVERIIDAAHTTSIPEIGEDIGREIRGLAIVLLYASYENLLTSICRTILDTALSLQICNNKLRNGLKLFAIYESIQSICDTAPGKIWSGKGLELLSKATDTHKCTINSGVFPNDGSFMKRTQVAVFFNLFELGDPGAILKEVWTNLDVIVDERNGIAHGRLTPDEVGRNYTLRDIRSLTTSWKDRWISFIDHVEANAKLNRFYSNIN